MSRSGRRIDVIFEPVMRSRAMKALDRMVQTVAPRDLAVTIQGESGCGKEVIARRLHELSARRAGPFVAINCAAIPEGLFESELFGHERGAFTGASERARGKVEAADGGTLFLDELAEMPLQVQAKLLRFLENRRFMRVGGTEKLAVDVRLICATLRRLEDEVHVGRFRADLFYRVQGVVLEVPPLRERPLDLLPLSRQLLAQSAARHGLPSASLSRGALAALERYAWPGNVRELRNVLGVAAVLRAGRSIRPADLPPAIRAEAGPPPAPARPAGTTLEVRLDRPLAESVDAIIRAAVDLEDGNRSRAAARLGIGLRTVQRRLA
jgi:DNA-binding NtrC family response regulator